MEIFSYCRIRKTEFDNELRPSIHSTVLYFPELNEVLERSRGIRSSYVLLDESEKTLYVNGYGSERSRKRSDALVEAKGVYTKERHQTEDQEFVLCLGEYHTVEDTIGTSLIKSFKDKDDLENKISSLLGVVFKSPSTEKK